MKGEGFLHVMLNYMHPALLDYYEKSAKFLWPFLLFIFPFSVRIRTLYILLANFHDHWIISCLLFLYAINTEVL